MIFVKVDLFKSRPVFLGEMTATVIVNLVGIFLKQFLHRLRVYSDYQLALLRYRLPLLPNVFESFRKYKCTQEKLPEIIPLLIVAGQCDHAFKCEVVLPCIPTPIHNFIVTMWSRSLETK